MREGRESEGPPRGWGEQRLGDVAQISFSNVDKKSRPREPTVRLCNYMDVYSNDYVHDRLPFMRATASATEIQRFGLKEGDVIITKDSETPDDIGVSAVVRQVGPDVVCGYHLALIRPNSGEVTSGFLGIQLRTHRLARYFAKEAQGSTRYGLSTASVTGIPVWLAPFPEQRRIVEILDTLDEAIRKTEQVIAKLQQMKQGLLHDLLTRGIDENGELRDPERHPEHFKDSPLGRIPKGWEVSTLGEAVEILHGYAFEGAHFSDQPVGPVLLTPGNFHRDGGLYFTDSNTKWFGGKVPRGYLLAPGDIVTVMTDLSPRTLILGSTVVLGQEHRLLHNQRIGKVAIRATSDWAGRFVALQMSAPSFRRRVIVEATGTTVRHTSPSRMKANLIARPPIDEQRTVVQAVATHNAQVLSEQRQLVKLRTLKQGLLDDLLTGRVRVTAPEEAA